MAFSAATSSPSQADFELGVVQQAAMASLYSWTSMACQCLCASSEGPGEN